MTEPFELESPEPGVVPDRVIDELRRCYREAKDYGAAFADALKKQAEKHAVVPSALRRYVAALEGDSLEEMEHELRDLERLIG